MPCNNYFNYTFNGTSSFIVKLYHLYLAFYAPTITLMFDGSQIFQGLKVKYVLTLTGCMVRFLAISIETMSITYNYYVFAKGFLLRNLTPRYKYRDYVQYRIAQFKSLFTVLLLRV